MYCTAVPEAQNAIQHATIAINRAHTHTHTLQPIVESQVNSTDAS